MASKSKTAKREKHASYTVVLSAEHNCVISGPLSSKSEAMRTASAVITGSTIPMTGPFALLKTRQDVVATFDVQTVEVVKLAKL